MANRTIDSRYLLSRELKVSFSARMVDEANAAEAGLMLHGSVVSRWLASSAIEMFGSRSPDDEEGTLAESSFPRRWHGRCRGAGRNELQELSWIEEACKTPSASLVSTTKAINSQTHCRVCAAFMEKKQSCEAKNEKDVATMNSCGQRLCNPH